MLIALIAATLIAFLAGLALPKVFALAPAAWAHLALAVGAMTLITAAMQHFVPVLARTRGAGKWLARLPLLMLLAGGVAVAAFAGWLPFVWASGAAVLALLGMAVMTAWMLERATEALGRPHPGLNWYVAAMACLGLALAAALMIPLFPDWHPVLRAFHWHLNLYGFVGLTAVGTLQVLMPTAAGAPDAFAPARLRTDLKWAVSGAFLLALGVALQTLQSAWSLALVWLGVAAWAWVVGRMVWSWLGLYRARLFAWHGAEPVLLVATLGFVLALLAAALDASGVATHAPLALFLPAFLMPLVTGAAAVLAPVWMNPAKTAAHARGRIVLGRWGGVRALLFLVAGTLPLLGVACSGMPALTALLWFGGLFLMWLWRES